jgi:hypothetical protein
MFDYDETIADTYFPSQHERQREISSKHDLQNTVDPTTYSDQ